MNQQVILIVFQAVVLVFAFCIHEASHAWMASRLGDQTARMLGRVTLNPAKHIDPIGSVVIPALAMFSGLPLIGWAKPCPVTLRNFKKVKRDDILTTIAGPLSNLAVAILCLIFLIVMEHTHGGYDSVLTAAQLAFHDKGADTTSLPAFFPIAMLLYYGIWINLSLFVFNLIPLPPLDGSHIFRYLLPYNAQKHYDKLGMFSIFLLIFFGGRVMGVFFWPMLDVFNRTLGL